MAGIRMRKNSRLLLAVNADTKEIIAIASVRTQDSFKAREIFFNALEELGMKGELPNDKRFERFAIRAPGDFGFDKMLTATRISQLRPDVVLLNL